MHIKETLQGSNKGPPHVKNFLVAKELDVMDAANSEGREGGGDQSY